MNGNYLQLLIYMNNFIQIIVVWLKTSVPEVLIKKILVCEQNIFSLVAKAMIIKKKNCMEEHKKFMRIAIDLANNNIKDGGGPFAAVVVKGGEIVGKGVNQVTNLNDPTAHAEMLAIREAAAHLKSYDLSKCILYTSCEPCPMCMGAIYWSRISTLYFGNNKEDAAQIDFDDAFIYKELNLPSEKRSVVMKPLLREEAIYTFNEWQKMSSKIKY